MGSTFGAKDAINDFMKTAPIKVLRLFVCVHSDSDNVNDFCLKKVFIKLFTDSFCKIIHWHSFSTFT